MPPKINKIPALVRVLSRFSLVTLLVFLAACASNSSLTISPIASQVYEVGTSSEAGYAVSVEVMDAKVSNFVEELPTILVKVGNYTDDPVYFGPDRVKVKSGGEPVRIYDSVDLALRIQEKIQKEAEEYTGRQAEVILQSGASQADPSAALANLTAAKRTNRTAASRESRQSTIEEVDKLLKSGQVPQYEWVNGLVKLHFEDLVQGAPLTVTVTVGEESYDFVFDVK